MTTEEFTRDILVYFVPTMVLIVTLVIGNAVYIQRELIKKGWKREDEPPWDDDLE